MSPRELLKSVPRLPNGQLDVRSPAWATYKSALGAVGREYRARTLQKHFRQAFVAAATAVLDDLGDYIDTMQ